MPILLPEDNIPASGEITPTSRLGLPKIPRASNYALAALNAITRILDSIVLRNDGGAASGEYTFSKINTPEAIIASLTATSAIINSLHAENLTALSGSVTNLSVVEVISADTGEIENLNAEAITSTSLIASTLESITAVISSIQASSANLTTATIGTLSSLSSTLTTLLATTGTISTLTATTATVENLTCKSGIFDSITLKGSSSANTIVVIGSIGASYTSATPHAHTSTLSIVPDVIDYSLSLTDSEALIEGKFNVKTGQASYTIVDKGTAFDYATTDRTGLGFPKISTDLVYTLEFSEGELKLMGYGILDYTLAEPFTFTYKATQNRIV